ncbi:MAG: acetate--CoA ligase family protein [Deltaproteobacteria bacterium]|nr:acetate--CoA ligase family protein [Deltaproteobacteria bacterium]
MPSSLDAILRPRSVAVIGASRKRGTIAAEVFHNLLHHGFPGAVYPVNPHSQVVQSVRAWRSVEEIPDPVDLAVLVVPAAQVPEAVEACGRKGVKGIVTITAGFAETGAEGRALQARIDESLRKWGMRMVGPNCLGVLNADPSVRLDATFAPTFPPYGNVAFSSQSGALGLAILDQAKELGVGISQFVSVGNKADVGGNDLLEHWEVDPQTEVILLYMENLGDPRRFMELSRRIARKKPIAVVKSGRTEAGARAASSHTGALAGMDVAVDALLGQAGVIRTDTIDELFDVAMLLANQPVPRGRRVAVLTNAGGPGIMASDACESRGLIVAQLAEGTQGTLRTFLPAEASVKNPVDMIASATAESYRRALRILLDDPTVDSVLVVFVTPIVTDAEDVAAAIMEASAGTEKTVVTCFMGRHGVHEAVTSLRARRIPSYAFPESAAAALARASGYGAWLAAPEGRIPDLDGVDRELARPVLADLGPRGARWLRPQEVRAVLAAYGIRTPRAIEAHAADEAARLSDEVGFPLVMKLASDTITHKTDVGGVVLGLRDREAVRAAFLAMEERMTARGRRAEMRGALLQQMVEGGVETFVGATRDPQYGHLLGFGIGGVHVELWKDVAFRVAPIRDVEARAMLDQIKARALLDGFRGGPKVDKESLTEVLLRVSRMVGDHPQIVEVDVNPLIALPDGCVAVDARIRVARG